MTKLANEVLNAFRHHCDLHAIVQLALFVKVACSTPFGIIAICTAISLWADDRQPVLNAFRHHCDLHLSQIRRHL